MNLLGFGEPLPSQSAGEDVLIEKNRSCKNHDKPSTAKIRPKRERKPRYKCGYCEHRACTKSDLTKHERVHTGERPYMCHVCGEGYSQSSHLHDHAKLHAGIKPYACDVCLRGFSKKSDMQRHRRIHTGELPYSCAVCGKAFRQTTQCSNHVKKHHGNVSPAPQPNAKKPNIDVMPAPQLDDGQSKDILDITEDDAQMRVLFNFLSSDLLLENACDSDLFDTQYFDENPLLSCAVPFLC